LLITSQGFLSRQINGLAIIGLKGREFILDPLPEFSFLVEEPETGKFEAY